MKNMLFMFDEVVNYKRGKPAHAKEGARRVFESYFRCKERVVKSYAENHRPQVRPSLCVGVV